MQLKYSSNLPGFIAELKKVASGVNRVNTLTVSNNSGYAAALNDLRGYYVMNDDRAFRTLRREIRNLENLKIPLNQKNLEAALRRGAIKYINWLRSYSGTTGPFRKGSGQRQAHPGKWGDITGLLNNSFRFRLNSGEWETEPEWEAGKAAARAKYAELFGGK